MSDSRVGSSDVVWSISVADRRREIRRYAGFKRLNRFAGLTLVHQQICQTDIGKRLSTRVDLLQLLIGCASVFDLALRYF